MTAYRKLDLYLTIVSSAVKVCASHYSEAFKSKVIFNSQGITANQNELKCYICKEDLIEYDKFM